jgi:Tfp pilus assembly protein PilO
MTKNKRATTLIFGIATAIVVVLSQLFCFQHQPEIVQVKEGQEEKSNNTEKQVTVISLPSAQSQQANTQVVTGFILIEELKQKTEEKIQVVKQAVSTGSKFFQTVFRFLISPNAP